MSQRRLTAILAADVVGYSRLMGDDESGTLDALKAHRKDLFDPEIAQRGGRTVKLMGDGVLVEFPSVVDAVEAAISVQRALANDDGPIKLRMGINLGDVIVDGEEIYGDGVNVAARLEAEAETGGVCISSIVHESVRNRVTATFEDIGLVTLKNIDHPLHLFQWSPNSAGNSRPKRQQAGKSNRAALVASVGAILIAALGTAVGYQLWQSPNGEKKSAAVAAVSPVAEASAPEKVALKVEGGDDATAATSSPAPAQQDESQDPVIESAATPAQPDQGAPDASPPKETASSPPGTAPTPSEPTSSSSPDAEAQLDNQPNPDPETETATATTEPESTSEPEQVPGGDIAELLAGKTLRGGQEFGGDTFVMRLSAGGNFRGEIRFNDAFGSGGVDSGRWTIRGDSLCVNFSTFANGRKVCTNVMRNGDTVSFKTPDGRDRKWTLASE